MMSTPKDPTSEDAILDELTREARRRGSLVFVMTRDDWETYKVLYLMWALGLILGLILGSD